MPIDVALKDQILYSAIDLGIGVTNPNVICPFCNGGDSRDKSFSVRRYDTVIYYQCYRAKCGEKGIIPTVINGFVPESKPRKIRKYYGNMIPPTREQMGYIQELWGLLPVELSSNRVTVDDESGDLVFPLFTIEGYDAGHMLRRMDGRKPKTLTFWSEDVPNCHFPRREALTSSCFVVEDIPSAIRASRYMSSCALLGTHLSEDIVATLARNFHTIYLALDNDATKKAIGYKRKYSLSFGNFIVVPLSKDVKNMKEIETNELMGGLLGETITRSIS
jgi:hypothetical protein